MAYLITCSAKKIKLSNHQISTIDQLSFNDQLGCARKELIDLLKINLDWNSTLPAWQLYDGKVYRKIQEENWEKHHSEIKILSALFGWVNPTDLLPYYDLEMGTGIPSINKKVYKFWQDKNILQLMISDQDTDLLSDGYRKAINKKSVLIAKPSPVVFTDDGDRKGEWLNNQLNNI